MSGNSLGRSWLALNSVPAVERHHEFSKTALAWFVGFLFLFSTRTYLICCFLYRFYFYYGFAYGSWVSHIPEIEAGLGLTDGELGTILLAGGLGAMAGILFAMWIARNAGSAKSLFLGALLILLLPLCGTKYLVLGAVCLGFTCGVLDLSNSSHAVCLEKLLKSKIVGSMLAMNSFGNILGVLVGGVCDYYGVTPFLHFVALSSVGSILSSQFYTFLVNFETEKIIMMNDGPYDSLSVEEIPEDDDFIENENVVVPSPTFRMVNSLTEMVSDMSVSETSLHTSRHESSSYAKSNDDVVVPELMRMGYRNSPRISTDRDDIICGCHSKLIFICLIAFVNMVGVSSVNNWCTVYFSSTLRTSPFLSSIGYAAFELSVMIGQMSSDTILYYVGSTNVVKWAGCIASVGMFVVVIAPSFPKLVGVPCELQNCSLNWQCAQLGIVGYAVTGFGISFVSPMLVSYTGKLKLPMMTSTGQIGRLTGSSYLGVLLSPFIFGELSMILNGLRWALLGGALTMTLIPILASFAFESDIVTNDSIHNDRGHAEEVSDQDLVDLDHVNFDKKEVYMSTGEDECLHSFHKA